MFFPLVIATQPLSLLAEEPCGGQAQQQSHQARGAAWRGTLQTKGEPMERYIFSCFALAEAACLRKPWHHKPDGQVNIQGMQVTASLEHQPPGFGSYLGAVAAGLET